MKGQRALARRALDDRQDSGKCSVERLGGATPRRRSVDPHVQQSTYRTLSGIKQCCLLCKFESRRVSSSSTSE
eukprot:7394-Eustigmatos_ZCMA.PRE.1